MTAETEAELEWLENMAGEFDEDFGEQESSQTEADKDKRVEQYVETASEEQESESTDPNDGTSIEVGPSFSGGGGFCSDGTSLVCDECEKSFEESWLKKHFDCNTCDECRDKDGKHGLVTKTDACNEYLLRDEDFFSRQPPLKFISKKNPHNANWGIMKLFLRSQVEDRALEVWGSEEALEAEMEKREDKKAKSKKRTFDKMIKELRMNARSSLKAPVKASHQHEFGEESYDDEEDVYRKKCKTCEHVSEYEKM